MPTGNSDVTDETSVATTNNKDIATATSSVTGNGDTNGSNNEIKGQICGTKLPTGTFDPTPYVQRARVTRPAPPKPSYNPMQFVQIKPCNLYQSAQEQLKRAEEVKKVKEIKKEDPEDWQNNLDNWKSSRRKRVEHIIDRVVEVKKFELEEHDRTRRKSKTFSEMMEERTSKGRPNKLASLAVYTEDESNDFSDFGIGTSSASGKSSLSEDYDNNSVLSDNADTEKQTNYKNGNTSNNDDNITNSRTREYISSPGGYETSSSTAPGSSPDPCEYTYEGAIEDYKSRISKTVGSTKSVFNNNNNMYRNKDSITPERTLDQYVPRRMSGTKIEDRLMNFEQRSTATDSNESVSALNKKDLPKVDILKRRELFEKENSPSATDSVTKERRFSGANGAELQNTKSIRERLTSLEKKPNSTDDIDKKKINRLSGDIASIKNRFQNMEQNNNQIQDTVTDKIKTTTQNKLVDVPVVPLKERLSSLQNAVTKEEIKKPVMLVDEHQLEILKKEDQEKQKALNKIQQPPTNPINITLSVPGTNLDDEQHSNSSHEILSIPDESNIDTDREDSGIHTTDVSCSVSQTDEQAELVNEDQHQHPINIDSLHHHHHHHNESSVNHSNNNDHHHNNEHGRNNHSNNLSSDIQRSLENNIELKCSTTDEKNFSSAALNPSTTSETDIKEQELINENDLDISVSEAIEMALKAIDTESPEDENPTIKQTNKEFVKEQQSDASTSQLIVEEIETTIIGNTSENHESPEKIEPIYQNFNEAQQTSLEFQQINPKNEQISEKQIMTLPIKSINFQSNQSKITKITASEVIHPNESLEQIVTEEKLTKIIDEPYYSVPKPSEPYYEVPKHPKPIPVYENVDLFYNQITLQTEMGDFNLNTSNLNGSLSLEPPKEKPPPPPIDNDMSDNDADVDDEDPNHTYETITHKTTQKFKTQSKNVTTGDEVDGKINPKHQEIENENSSINGKPIKRMNSTKRIKKEIRNKRSSFLGIEGTNDDDSYLELSVAPPPDMVKLLQEERRLEKQLYMKAGLYDSSDAADSRDSGVSENHSRQSSEPFTNSSEEHEDLLKRKEKEIIEVLEKEEEKQKQTQTTEWQNEQQTTTPDSETKIQCIEDQIREQEEVLRVERELLQLEQEELKRQRENLMLRENIARQELQHGAKMLMSATTRSMVDINTPIPQTAGPQHQKHQQQQPNQVIPQTTHQRQLPISKSFDDNSSSNTNLYANLPAHQIYQCVETDYRKSMSDLHDFRNNKVPGNQHNGLSIVTTPVAAPAKPIRSNLTIDSGTHKSQITNGHATNYLQNGGGLVKIAHSSSTNNTVHNGVSPPQLQHSQSSDDFTVPLRNYQTNSALHNGGNMTRHTLLALSATPKPKYTDAWVQQSTQQNHSKLAHDRAHEAWLNQQKRKSVPDNFNYNKHWLIQEAEQRRIDQQRGLYRPTYNSVSNATTISTNGWTNSAIQRNGTSDNKPLPDAVIQTITQRVQSKGIGERKRLEAISTESLTSSTNSIINAQNITSTVNSSVHGETQGLLQQQTPQDKILSVSGRKKCSHCGEELGRGAAMIIESLRLFYHIGCFKCCVCHVQLGDGLNGTDVRVRNQKLHCHNCYSSDDGIKFSCV